MIRGPQAVCAGGGDSGRIRTGGVLPIFLCRPIVVERTSTATRVTVQHTKCGGNGSRGSSRGSSSGRQQRATVPGRSFSFAAVDFRLFEAATAAAAELPDDAECRSSGCCGGTGSPRGLDGGTGRCVLPFPGPRHARRSGVAAVHSYVHGCRQRGPLTGAGGAAAPLRDERLQPPVRARQPVAARRCMLGRSLCLRPHTAS